MWGVEHSCTEKINCGSYGKNIGQMFFTLQVLFFDVKKILAQPKVRQKNNSCPENPSRS